jgi:hypothetical protein|tara:strand:+ start:1129 stop:1920 length:792 start_codon:yes stop_codon:yes gene_type:complete
MGVNYAYLDPKHSKQVMLNMLTQDKTKYLMCEDDKNWKPEFPEDMDALFVTGTLRGCGNVCKEAVRQDKNWFYMDNGYGPFWKRVTFKGTAPTRLLDRPNDRTPEELRHLQPWKGGKNWGGENILILPPSLPYMDAFEEINWLNKLCHTINEFTGRNLVIRPKPAKGKKAPPWDSQLATAAVVVSFGSNLAIDAMVKGVPTISYKYCPAFFGSFKLEDLDTDALMEEPDREKIINNCMYHSFHKHEFNNGFAWETSMENAYGS